MINRLMCAFCTSLTLTLCEVVSVTIVNFLQMVCPCFMSIENMYFVFGTYYGKLKIRKIYSKNPLKLFSVLPTIRVLKHCREKSHHAHAICSKQFSEAKTFWLDSTGDVARTATTSPPGMHGRFGGCRR